MTVARSIFISYRRRDSIDITGRIYDRLVGQFGSDSVFKDVDAIPFGVDFRKHLEREVSHCPALLAIIGPEWLGATDANGNRRLDNPSDWVRIEIETALKRDSVVIPVLVGGAKLPRDHELPESLKGLAYRQSALVRPDPDFHRDVDRLIQRIEEVFSGLTLTGGSNSTSPLTTSAPYAKLIDDLATALTHATRSTSRSSGRSLSRRRWLRLMGLGLAGAGGTLATRRWWPALQAASARRLPQQLPQLTSLPERLQTVLTAATDSRDRPFEAEATSQYSYQSVTVDHHGSPLYQTRFVTNLSENIQVELGEGSSTISLVTIMGGQFLFGASTEEVVLSPGQLPQTAATVASFAMGVYPVTQEQWRVVAQLPTVDLPLPPNPAYFQGDERPVERVSWYEAMEFCNRLSRYTRQRFRLPTEVEWEFACRAKTTTPFHFGPTLTTDLANYDGTHPYRSEAPGLLRGRTTPVGYFQVANEFGLYDMHGNVMEWCNDQLQDGGTSLEAPSAGNNPDFIFPNQRVLRGGSWESPPQNCRSASRLQMSPNTRSKTIGFRIVRDLSNFSVF